MTSTSSTDALERWFRSNGGFMHSHVRVACNQDSHVHWHGSEVLEQGSVITAVPHALALSYLNALVDDAFPVFRLRRDAFRIEAIGFFYLVAQYVNRERSFWKPYLDTIPGPDEDFSQPLWFEEAEDVAWLAGTDVWHTICARKEVYHDYFSAGILALRESGVHTEPYSWRLFKWAITIFSSRSFSSRALQPQDSKYWTTYKTSLENGRRQTIVLDMSRTPAEDLDFPVLFPVMDASNHNHHAKVDWAFDPGRFTLSVAECIPANQEILNNYGPKANDELLLGYGFCIPDNPYDNIIMALKAPPHALQDALRASHPGYFTESGTWNTEKSTFRLRRPTQPTAHRADPESVFHSLPPPLLELLVHILRFDRGLEFTALPNPISYLLSPYGKGRRYLFPIARVLAASLAPKLNALQTTELPNDGIPRNDRQRQASIYRTSQVEILQNLTQALRTYTRSLLFSPHSRSGAAEIRREGPKLATLESLHAWLFPSDGREAEDTNPTSTPPPTSGLETSDFIAGLTPSTGTADFAQLRLAGWEEDVFVLLLCWMALSPPSASSRADADLPEYVNLEAFAHGPETPEGVEGDDEDDDNDLIRIVHAAAIRLPHSLWADQRWSMRFIAGVGGAMVRHESSMVMCPDGQGGEEARLCVYLHG